MPCVREKENHSLYFCGCKSGRYRGHEDILLWQQYKGCYGSGKDGVTDGAALEEMLKADPQAACFYVQQPNYYGNIEDGDALGRIVHEAGAKYIMGCNPMALAVMKTPAEYGADIAVGDGQPLGMPLAFGGPYLGFMTATAAMTRKLPGRIVGETADHEGRRGICSYSQAREQHIRREKASSTCAPTRHGAL